MQYPDTGYLYIAHGDRFINEAETSARSLRRVDSQAHITLVANRPVESDAFDLVQVRPDTFGDRQEASLYKVKHIVDGSPYQKTFYLDTDTCFLESCRPLFQYLDHADLCLTLAPADGRRTYIGSDPLPDRPVYNGGLIIYRKNQATQDLFSNWRQILDERLAGDRSEWIGDQPPLSEAVLQSQTRVHLLSNTWNARTELFIQLCGPVRLIHGRHDDFAEIGRRLNLTTQNRCWDPRRQRCLYARPPLARRVRSLLKRIIKGR